MSKRLIIGLAAGALVLAMLPGVANATPGNEDVKNFGMCVKNGWELGALPNPELLSDGVGPAVVNKNVDKHTMGKPFMAPFSDFRACQWDD